MEGSQDNAVSRARVGNCVQARTWTPTQLQGNRLWYTVLQNKGHLL